VRGDPVRDGVILSPAPTSFKTARSQDDKVQCAKTGHGLGQTEHEADRWFAATAIWLRIPLMAHDAIFANVKDLHLLTKLDLRIKIVVQLTCN